MPKGDRKMPVNCIFKTSLPRPPVAITFCDGGSCKGLNQDMVDMLCESEAAVKP